MSDSPSQLFGRRLRSERERRRITLDTIAANTKIGIALLRGLERGDVSRWPSGIFRRSFIREYSTAIGLDADKTTREFLERFPDPGDCAGPPPSKAPDPVSLRLTLAETGPRLIQGLVSARSWRRWAAIGSDLGSCLVVSSILFLIVGQWWKPLSVTMIGYYAFSILLLGSTPGLFFFAGLKTPDDKPRPVAPAASPAPAGPPPRMELAPMRQSRPFVRVDPAPHPAAANGAPEVPPLLEPNPPPMEQTL